MYLVIPDEEIGGNEGQITLVGKPRLIEGDKPTSITHALCGENHSKSELNEVLPHFIFHNDVIMDMVYLFIAQYSCLV